MTQQVMQQALEALRKAMQGNLQYDEAMSSFIALNDAINQPAQAAQPAQQLNWSELAAWWESGAEQWDGLKDIVLRMVHPAQAPAGYKWVPLEPTPEMCEAYLEASLVYWVSDEEATTEEATAAGYRAAIAAAPEMKP